MGSRHYYGGTGYGRSSQPHYQTQYAAAW
jgi:hypothetical protein